MRLTWLIFLPLILAPAPAYKGLALADQSHMEDIDALGAEWWYSWGPVDTTGSATFVPMLWRGNPSTEIPGNYEGWILIFNEPNLPNQSNLSPGEAVIRFNAARAYYPRARLLCCGASVWAGYWTREFYALGGRPDAWHMHAYTEEWVTPGYAQMELAALHSLTGGEYWITEYGSPAGSLNDFRAMTEWFEQQEWITRIAAFTNRQPPGDWNIGAGVEMVNPGGGLTEIGAWYAGK